MKLLKKEEEQAHYREVIRGGISGAALGLALGIGGQVLLQRRSQFYKTLTIPLKAFFLSSSGTFFAIINADRRSRAYDISRQPVASYKDATAQRLEEERAKLKGWEKVKDWAREYRYPIVTTSWVGSMGASLALVSRDKLLTTPQKLVQARMYAQGLTLLVLIATAAFEVSDARTRKVNKEKGETGVGHVEHYAGEDMWKDMVEAEERRLTRLREANVRKQ